MKKNTRAKINTLVFASCITLNLATALYAENDTKPITLTSKVLKFIDGMPRAMDGYTILDMKIIHSKMRVLVHGIYDPETKKRVGQFEFQDKKASLHTLVRIETRIHEKTNEARKKLEEQHMDITKFTSEWQKKEHVLIEQFEEQLQRIEEEMITRHADDEKRFVAIKQEQRAIMRQHNTLLQKEIDMLKKEHINDFEQFTLELEKIEHTRQQQLALLQPGLAGAKQEFENITLPFMEQARGSKHFMVPLIEEWAYKAGHKDSYLLQWSEEPEGSEMKIFEQDIQSCQQLERMCCDLMSFLDAMIESSPKACKQYEELKDKLTHQTHPTTT